VHPSLNRDQPGATMHDGRCLSYENHPILTSDRTSPRKGCDARSSQPAGWARRAPGCCRRRLH